MAEVTYFVALPFVRTEDGELVPGEAVECPSSGAAVRRAAALAAANAGAVAFARSGDPSIGVFQDATVLASYGEVLTADELLAAD